MFKNSSVMLLFAFLIIVFFPADLCAQVEMEHYESKIILDLKWGDGPEEIGLKPTVPPEGSTMGPTSFEVDSNGLIYILDAFRSRCAVFNQKGKLVRSFPIYTDRNGGTDMDEDNNLWVINGHGYTVSKYSSEGILKQRIQYNAGPQGIKDYQIIIREGEIFLFYTQTKLQIDRSTAPSGNNGIQVFEAKKIELSRKKQARLTGRISKRFYECPAYSRKVGKSFLRVTEANGDEREILLIPNVMYSTEFLDEDVDGNIYFEINTRQVKQICWPSPEIHFRNGCKV